VIPNDPTRVKIGLLLIALFASVSQLQALRRARVAYRSLSRPDEVTLYEVRLRELKQALPAHGVVGYVSDSTGDAERPDSDQARRSFKRYLLTQDTLAPVVVVRSVNADLVVGDFEASGGFRPPGFTECSRASCAVPLQFAYLLCVGVKVDAVDRRAVGTSLVTLALVLSGYAFVELAAPGDYIRLLNSSVDRLLLQLWPTAAFTYFIIVPSGGGNRLTGEAMPWVAAEPGGDGVRTALALDYFYWVGARAAQRDIRRSSPAARSTPASEHRP
jgi:hypothetical protein